jgi:hypothetical protein
MTEGTPFILTTESVELAERKAAEREAEIRSGYFPYLTHRSAGCADG